MKLCELCGESKASPSETDTMSRCGSDKHPVEERCRRMADAVKDGGWPITFDEQMGEYHLQLGIGPDEDIRKGSAFLYYCPWCGGQLPESKRGDFFTKPAEVDVAAMKEVLQEAKDLTAIIAKLDSPDDEGTGCGPQNDPWVRWIRYSRTWKSLVVTIGEHADGRLSWGYCGQYIGPPEESD